MSVDENRFFVYFENLKSIDQENNSLVIEIKYENSIYRIPYPMFEPYQISLYDPFTRQLNELKINIYIKKDRKLYIQARGLIKIRKSKFLEEENFFIDKNVPLYLYGKSQSGKINFKAFLIDPLDLEEQSNINKSKLRNRTESIAVLTNPTSIRNYSQKLRVQLSKVQELENLPSSSHKQIPIVTENEDPYELDDLEKDLIELGLGNVSISLIDEDENSTQDNIITEQNILPSIQELIDGFKEKGESHIEKR